ncbi:GATase1 Hsp31-like family protein [Colletotrichum truncatum]|uniref:GATase1 Hsp31-like family protein n=1 Tax=Colletotrichum truncatum TaxID=5467 RepID=A0ACC3ZGQ4_COLTU|nr:GATase1 Hsp31-like family protein [Colletotrichum truncatum]KAF6790446.1 GATase1 Hsp31-like family protein [Colletotrichum truncatum]
MAPKKVLVVLTSVDKTEKNGKPIGWYLPELAHPYDVLKEAGVEMTFASPKGGVAPLDQASVQMFANDPSSKNFLENHKETWENTQPLSKFVGRASEFDAVFYPGGHGPMYDLAFDEDNMKLIAEFAAQNKPVSAVCHGPGAIVNAKTNDGEYLVKGRNVTGFSNTEEDQAGYTDEMNFLLEDRLKEVGGKYSKADAPWGEKVVVDGIVITGQNPASAKAVGEAIVKALGL